MTDTDQKRPPVHSYVSLDLETTGLNPKSDRIIEVGAVKVMEGRIVDRLEFYVNPGRKIEERITQITGITDDSVKDASYIEDVLPGLMTFLEDLPLLGHSVLFDYSFMKRAAVNAGLTFEKKGVDTLHIARAFLPELESRSLPFLCGYYGIPHKAHRALEDARATHLLYQKLWEQFGGIEEKDAKDEKAQQLWSCRPLQYQVKRESPATGQQKERLYKLLERHKITITVDIERMTRNEASRLTDQIYAEYGRT